MTDQNEETPNANLSEGAETPEPADSAAAEEIGAPLPFDSLTGGPGVEPAPEPTILEAKEGLVLPLYRCHKLVQALQIANVTPLNDGGADLSFVLSQFESIIVSSDFVQKHDPQPGTYLVFYDDGYKSISPAQAFEDGYSPEAIIESASEPGRFEGVPKGIEMTAAQAIASGPRHFDQAEWDLAVLQYAERVRANTERFKAARALPGGANVR